MLPTFKSRHFENVLGRARLTLLEHFEHVLGRDRVTLPEHFEHVLGRARFTSTGAEEVFLIMHKAETLHDHFGRSKLLPLRTCSQRADDSLIVSRNLFEMSDERKSFCMLQSEASIG